MTNYYNILGLEADAQPQDIKVAYRKLSKKFHPDLNPNDPFFHKMFLQIQEAYEILSNEALREKYDKILHNVHQPYVRKEKKKPIVPTIENFSCDKMEVIRNEVFTLTWKVSNADVVQIRPLGLFASEGFEKFKFDQLKGESVNLVLIATNSTTGLSAREHLVLYNRKYRKTLFENSQFLSFLIIALKVLIIVLIIVLFVMISIYGIQVNDPFEQS